MAQPGTLAYECRLSCISVTFQVLVAFVFILASLWAASLVMELLLFLFPDLLTTVPPGVRYANPRYYPSPPSPPPLSVSGEASVGRRLLPRFEAHF